MTRRLSRRHLLRGAGVGLALPWLASPIGTAAGRHADPIKRFLHVYLPNGASTLWWKTTGSGKGDAWQLSPLLSPFQPVKKKMLMIRQMGNFTWRKDLLTMSPAWTTYRERNDFAACAGCPSGAFIAPRIPAILPACSTVSTATSIAAATAKTSPTAPPTAKRWINCWLEAFRGRRRWPACSSAFSTAAAGSTNATAPCRGTCRGARTERLSVRTSSPRASSTSSSPPVPAAAPRRPRRPIVAEPLDLSVLDALKQSTTSLQKSWGPAIAAGWTITLTGVRELEIKVQASPAPAQPCQGRRGARQCDRSAVRSRAMNDLIVMALQCDVTRIITYMLDNSRSDLVYSWVQRRDYEKAGATVGGTATSYHESQHQTGTSPDFASITRWHIEAVADLLTKMDAVQEASGGTLLDNSLVMFGSDMHHGDHAAFDLPLLLFGSGGGSSGRTNWSSLPETIEDIRQMRDLHFTILNDYFKLGRELRDRLARHRQPADCRDSGLTETCVALANGNQSFG